MPAVWRPTHFETAFNCSKAFLLSAFYKTTTKRPSDRGGQHGDVQSSGRARVTFWETKLETTGIERRRSVMPLP
jgi:hypothetical protein